MSEPATPRTQVRVAQKLPIWVKLWTVVILANIGGFAAAIWVAGSVRAIVSSSGVETAMMFGYYTAMAIVAAADALLLDELLFKGAFRKTHLEGKSARFTKGGSVEEVAATMQRTTMRFPFLLLACGGATYLVFNFINHDFDAYYLSLIHI